MAAVVAFFIFALVAGGMAAMLLKNWVKPKEALDRVTSVSVQSLEDMQMASATHPSLVFRDLVQRLGTLVPASPADVSIMQRRLIKAGMRGPNAVKLLYGAKVALGILFPVLALFLVANGSSDPTNKVMYVLGAAAAGFFGPNEYVNMRVRKRQKEIQRGLSNALDLMVVCVESGLGLDQAILQVAKELEHAHRDISEEFTLVNLELKAGKRRVEALRNLAERTSAEDLKKLVAVLIQADRFGTGIAQSLRGHADYMRVQARQIAEEKAAKLGVKLVFPIFFCILPSLFVITVGPIVMRIIRELIPMMNNM